MAEIKLNKRYKYAGDIFPKLIDIGFDIETATDFLNNIKDADVEEVVRCKDCKYGEIDDVDFPDQYLCHISGSNWNEGNHFCSYGERSDT